MKLSELESGKRFFEGVNKVTNARIDLLRDEYTKLAERRSLTPEGQIRFQKLRSEMNDILRDANKRIREHSIDAQYWQALRQIADRRGDETGTTISQADLDLLEQRLTKQHRQQSRVEAAVKNVKPEVAKFADALGRGLDPGIARAVALMNVAGFTTTSSCEGHVARGILAAYIHVLADSETVQRLRTAAIRFNKSVPNAYRIHLIPVEDQIRVTTASEEEVGGIRKDLRTVYSVPRDQYVRGSRQAIEHFAESLTR